MHTAVYSFCVGIVTGEKYRGRIETKLFLSTMDNCRSVQIQCTDSRGQPLDSCRALKFPPALLASVIRHF
jgi:hypothetical protein